MTSEETSEALLKFIRNQLLPHSSAPINADTPLVSAGLVDSFGLIDILTELETLTKTKIPSSRVRPADLDSVNKMIALVDELAGQTTK